MMGPDGLVAWAPVVTSPAFSLTLAEGGKLISRTPNTLEYGTIHSLEGWVMAATLEIRGMLEDWERLSPAGKAKVIAALQTAPWQWRNPARPSTAWHATTLQRTRFGLVQHAPAFARLAHGNAANPYSCGIESEGLQWEPFDDQQCETLERYFYDLGRFTGRDYRRNLRTLVEHREKGPTACPSNRPAPLYAREIDPVTLAELETRIRNLENILVRNGIALDPTKLTELTTGDAALDLAVSNGWSAFLGIAQARQWAAEAKLDARTALDLVSAIDAGELADVVDIEGTFRRILEATRLTIPDPLP